MGQLVSAARSVKIFLVASIPLNSTADREWFFNECEALYKNRITKEQFVADGAKQFPGYEASFNELAGLLTTA